MSLPNQQQHFNRLVGAPRSRGQCCSCPGVEGPVWALRSNYTFHIVPGCLNIDVGLGPGVGRVLDLAALGFGRTLDPSVLVCSFYISEFGSLGAGVCYMIMFMFCLGE